MWIFDAESSVSTQKVIEIPGSHLKPMMEHPNSQVAGGFIAWALRRFQKNHGLLGPTWKDPLESMVEVNGF